MRAGSETGRTVPLPRAQRAHVRVVARRVVDARGAGRPRLPSRESRNGSSLLHITRVGHSETFSPGCSVWGCLPTQHPTRTLPAHHLASHSIVRGKAVLLAASSRCFLFPTHRPISILLPSSLLVGVPLRSRVCVARVPWLSLPTHALYAHVSSGFVNYDPHCEHSLMGFVN